MKNLWFLQIISSIALILLAACQYPPGNAIQDPTSTPEPVIQQDTETRQSMIVTTGIPTNTFIPTAESTPTINPFEAARILVISFINENTLVVTIQIQGGIPEGDFQVTVGK